MRDTERIEKLRNVLAKVIDWYEGVLAQGEPDSSYLYDTTYEVFNDNLSRGDFQQIIELLRQPQQGVLSDRKGK